MGILALRLIYGPKFKINNKFKDSDLNLRELKNLCLPQVYELIQRSVKANQRNRISLKQFLNLSVFSQIQIDYQVKNKFITGNSQRIKKSTIMKSSILQKSINRKNTDIFKMTVSSQIHISQSNKLQIPNKIKKSTQKQGKLAVLSEVKANKIYNQLRWMLQKCLYLAEIKDYTQTSAHINQMSIEDKTVIRYLYYKISEINLQRFKQLIQFDPIYKSFRESLNSKDLYKDLLDCIQQNANSKDIKSIIGESVEYQNKMKKLDPKQLKLLSEFDYIASNIKKNIQSKKNNIEQLAQYFATINGKFYTSLKTYIENTETIQNKGIKIRAICYFILSSYIILSKPTIQDQQQQLSQLLNNDFKIYKYKFYDQQRLQGSIHVKFVDQIQYIRLCQFTKRAKQNVLIENCQNILIKYFKIINSNQKPNNELQKDYKRRTSLKVPTRINY